MLFDLVDEVDVGSLLTGSPLAEHTHIEALVLATGRRERLTRAEFDALTRVPVGRAVDASEIGVELARSLLTRGLLTSDDGADAAMVANGWNLYAAGYHFMTKRAGVDLRESPDFADWAQVGNPVMRAWVDEHGEAPPPFHDPAPGAPRVPLPRTSPSGGLFDALARRRTTRRFAFATPMRLDDLATLMWSVFGAQGVAETDLGVTVKRTSPSGGARHAVEAYALVAHVEGLASGLYHYDMQAHALTRLKELDDAAAVAQQLACGQEFAGETHVSFILTARFDRCFWKYRRTDKGYGALLMEAGHLSQTLYLLAAALGLGAWVTLAINSVEIEDLLELDGVDEGALAMLGCGVPSDEPSPLDMPFKPLS